MHQAINADDGGDDHTPASSNFDERWQAKGATRSRRKAKVEMIARLGVSQRKLVRQINGEPCAYSTRT